MIAFSSNLEKVSLFRDYFRGRENIYAQARLTKEGRKACFPVCKYRANGRYCEYFGEHGCKGCQRKENDPLTDEVVLRHLLGKETIGVYPLLDDNTCFFLAIDFDGEGYKEAAKAFVKAASNHGLSVLTEVSSSGKGAHCYLFFLSAIKAWKARQLGSHLLLEAMELSPSVGFSSFDRMFPTSDYLPKGGVGNLILLPLQGEKAKKGTTLFVDINFLPLPLSEQLSYLASVPKIMEAEVDLILKGKRDDYNYGPLPKSLRSLTKLSKEDFPEALVYEDKGEIIFSKAGFSKETIRYLERVASLPNPQYYERQRKRMPLFVAGEPVLPRFLHLDRQDETFISFPRGMREDLHRLFEMVNLKTVKKDLRNKGKPIEVSFKGTLRPEQEEALKAMLKKENGLLEARTSFGKTVLAIALIAKLGVNALIVVPKISLLTQWKEKLNVFLDIEETVLKRKTIRFGEYHGAKKRLTGKVDVASIDSLNSEEGRGSTFQLWPSYLR